MMLSRIWINPQGIAAEDIQYFQEFDAEMLEEFLNDITQNAQQPQGTSRFLAQNPQQSQDAVIQSAQHIMISLQDTNEVCNTEDSVISEIEMQMHADKQRDAKVNDMMKAIAMQLRRPSLSDHERLELQQKEL
ncbi:hypothetical protein BASA61_005831 [Batrachochytrium salamandrivorans]|nr:hypothetical protein BASA61_005831 [Batrachochytrium salamandrivorans]